MAALEYLLTNLCLVLRNYKYDKCDIRKPRLPPSLVKMGFCRVSIIFILFAEG